MLLYDGTPTGGEDVEPPTTTHTVLATTSVTTTSATDEVLTFDFANVPTLTAGNGYYFMIRKTAGSNGQVRMYLSGSLYADGVRLRRAGGNLDTPVSTIDLTFRITVTQTGGGSGDPAVFPYGQPKYYLENDERIYCMLDTNDSTDRLVINAKCQMMRSGKSYFRYVYVNYNGDSFVMKLPTMHIVDLEDGSLMSSFKLPTTTTNRFETDQIKETERTFRKRIFEIDTINYGKFEVVFKNYKNTFMVNGKMGEHGAGFMGYIMGSDKGCVVDTLDFIPQILP